MLVLKKHSCNWNKSQQDTESITEVATVRNTTGHCHEIRRNVNTVKWNGIEGHIG